MDDVFKALAADARRAIMDELHDRNGQTLFEICARLTMKHDMDMSRQAVSQHLDVLEAVGLVRTERDGRYKFHYLDTTPLDGLLDRWNGEGGRLGGGESDRGMAEADERLTDEDSANDP